jgi:hypothetical protein
MHSIIHKQALDITRRQVLKLPFGSKILCAKTQRDTICIWYSFNPYYLNDLVDNIIIILPTGQEFTLPEDLYHPTYIDTCFTQNQEFVWHVFHFHLKQAEA